jgi:hypothetical protein
MAVAIVSAGGCGGGNASASGPSDIGKLRHLRELYPMIRIKLFYARDFRALMLKYGRLDAAASLIGIEGQPPPRKPAPSGATRETTGAGTGA